LFPAEVSTADVKKALGKKPFQKMLTKKGNLRCKVGDIRRDCTLVFAGERSESLRADAYERAVAKLEAGRVSHICALTQWVPC
jgi:hypothetical protein